MTPAEEITAAAAKLRAHPSKTEHPNVGNALAKWLDSWTGIELRESATMQEDARHALTVARAVLGSSDG